MKVIKNLFRVLRGRDEFSIYLIVNLFQIFIASVIFVLVFSRLTNAFVDSSVNSYQAERTCGYNEICKEEFRKIFRCKCPSYLYCRYVNCVR